MADRQGAPGSPAAISIGTRRARSRARSRRRFSVFISLVQLLVLIILITIVNVAGFRPNTPERGMIDILVFTITLWVVPAALRSYLRARGSRLSGGPGTSYRVRGHG